MSDNYNDQDFHHSRSPILVEGETAKTDTERAGEGSGLTTADLASAGDRSTSESERVTDGTQGAPSRDNRTGTGTGVVKENSTPLFAADEAAQFRSRWDAIQVGFVDEPRKAVEQADELVAGTVKRLAQIFADERSKLEQQWSRGDQVSTEDLRIALQRYRSFFGRLLSV